MIVCSRCGTHNRPEAGACLLCGAALQQPQAAPFDPPAPTVPANPKPELGQTAALPPTPTPPRPAFNAGQTLALPPTAIPIPVRASADGAVTQPPDTLGMQRLGHTVGLPRPGDTVGLAKPGNTVGISTTGSTAELPSAAEPTPKVPAGRLPDLSVHDEDDMPTMVRLTEADFPDEVPHEPAAPVRAPLHLGQTLALPRSSLPEVPAAPAPPAAPPPSAEAPRQGPPPGLRSTVLGLGAPAIPEVAQQAAAAARANPGATLVLGPPGPKPMSRTMLGVAPEVSPNPLPAGVDPAQMANRTGQAAHTRTIMGVARPGIAPINPGLHKPGAPETFPSPPPPPPAPMSSMPAPPTGFPPNQQIGARTLTLRAARKSSLLAIVAIAAAVLLLAASAGLYFYLAGPEKIEARVVLDPEGRERILLRCPRCKDGTVVRGEGAETRFKGQQAELSVQRALRVGETPFTLGIRGPDSARENTVSLNVRIDYRVRADLGALAETPPRVRVLVDAIAGSAVTVDDRPVTLSGTGQGSADFDVSRELTGQDNSIRRLERRIAYAVVPPGGARQVGQVIVQLGIAPLVVDAPGETITVETPTFVLAGRTVKGGAVSVEGRPLRVDAEGRFAQVMNVSSVGETTISVRAVAPDHAPRLFPIRVRRVPSFADEAAKVRAQATTSYASIAEDIDKKRNWPVALDGSILERSNLEHSTLFLFEVTSGCRATPCLARVRYGARSELPPGERISVFGRVIGAVEGPRKNSQIPEILADFVLKAKR